MWRRLILSAFIILAYSSAQAVNDTKLHVRFGYLSGNYHGPSSGEFAVPTSVDLEYEWFKSNTHSVMMRLIMAVQLETAVPYYTYAGGGMRYYLKSKGMKSEESERGISFSSIPSVRYYAGWDFGIGYTIVRSLGKVLQIVSALLDAGVNVGTIYQVERNFGLEAQIGTSMGFGFSSVAVVGTSFRLLVGGSYFF